MANANLIDVTDFTTYAPDVDLTLFPVATLSGVISQASQQIVNYCAVTGFDYQAETAEVDRAALSPMGELMVAFHRRPVAVGDITSIQLKKGGFTTTLTLADSGGNVLYQIPYPGQRMYFPSSYLASAGTLILGGSTQLVTMHGADVFTSVTYRGGYSAGIPADLKLACVLWVRDILAWQFNNTGASNFSQGSYSSSFGADPDSRFLKQAKRLLNQGGYRRVSQF
ncbi:MAG TPA: hypothetical protein VNX65_02405 [Patescibacteria group bacterium]|jgi:hypothetical protein|nr:hypothetical protein [Patescibacteria group bacterium]